MTSTSPAENDAVRAAIMAAMDRLLEGTPVRSTGRLSASQLALEAGVKPGISPTSTWTSRTSSKLA